MSDIYSESNKKLKSVLFSPECTSLVNDYNRKQYNTSVQKHCYSCPDNFSSPECADFFRKNSNYIVHSTPETFQITPEDKAMYDLRQKIRNISEEIPNDVKLNIKQNLEDVSLIIKENVNKLGKKNHQNETFNPLPEEEKIKELGKKVAGTVETHFVLIVVIIIIVSCLCLLSR